MEETSPLTKQKIQAAALAEFLDKGLHQFVLSMRSWSEATPGSVPSSVKPKCL